MTGGKLQRRCTFEKDIEGLCRNHKTNYGFDNPVAREASCLGHLESWVEQAVKEYENSSQITADTKLWINTNLERMQGFLDQLEER